MHIAPAFRQRRPRRPSPCRRRLVRALALADAEANPTTRRSQEVAGAAKEATSGKEAQVIVDRRKVWTLMCLRSEPRASRRSRPPRRRQCAARAPADGTPGTRHRTPRRSRLRSGRERTGGGAPQAAHERSRRASSGVGNPEPAPLACLAPVSMSAGSVITVFPRQVTVGCVAESRSRRFSRRLYMKLIVTFAGIPIPRLETFARVRRF